MLFALLFWVHLLFNFGESVPMEDFSLWNCNAQNVGMKLNFMAKSMPSIQQDDEMNPWMSYVCYNYEITYNETAVGEYCSMEDFGVDTNEMEDDSLTVRNVIVGVKCPQRIAVDDLKLILTSGEPEIPDAFVYLGRLNKHEPFYGYKWTTKGQQNRDGFFSICLWESMIKGDSDGLYFITTNRFVASGITTVPDLCSLNAMGSDSSSEESSRRLLNADSDGSGVNPPPGHNHNGHYHTHPHGTHPHPHYHRRYRYHPYNAYPYHHNHGHAYYYTDAAAHDSSSDAPVHHHGNYYHPYYPHQHRHHHFGHSHRRPHPHHHNHNNHHHHHHTPPPPAGDSSPRRLLSSFHQIRLNGGGTQSSGRVEYRTFGGNWKWICGTSKWSQRECHVACSELGFHGNAMVQVGTFGSRSHDESDLSVECTGKESSLSQCNVIFTTHCTRRHQAGCICNPGDSSSSGSGSIENTNRVDSSDYWNGFNYNHFVDWSRYYDRVYNVRYDGSDSGSSGSPYHYPAYPRPVYDYYNQGSSDSNPRRRYVYRNTGSSSGGYYPVYRRHGSSDSDSSDVVDQMTAQSPIEEAESDNTNTTNQNSGTEFPIDMSTTMEPIDTSDVDATTHDATANSTTADNGSD